MRLLLIKATIPAAGTADLFTGTVHVKAHTRKGRTVAAHDQHRLLLHKPVPPADPAHVVRDAKSWLVARGRELGTEALVAWDGHTGEVTHRLYGTENHVSFTNELMADMANPKAAILTQHNHPGSGSLSRDDVTSLCNIGMSHVIAHGHDGTFYSASLGAALPEDVRGHVQVYKFLWAKYDSAYRVVYRVCEANIKAGLVSQADADAGFYDALLRVLHAQKIVDYRTSYEPPKDMKNVIKISFDFAGVPDEIRMFDRHPLSIRPDEGLNRCIAECQALARRRSTEGGGDSPARNDAPRPGSMSALEGMH